MISREAIFNTILYLLLLGAATLTAACHGPAARQRAGEDSSREQMEEHLAGASATAPEGGGWLMALIIPAGGGGDAAGVSAHGLKALEGLRFDTVVVVGQAHNTVFRGASVYAEDVFETPAGPMQVDGELARRIISADDGVIFRPHVDPGEYAGPDGLALLKRLCNGCRVVPVLIGQPDQGTYDRLVAALATAATKRRTRVLLVAMTDLSKGMPYERAVETDARTLESVASLKAGETLRLLRSEEAWLTGGHAVLVVMEAVRRAGADLAEVFRHETVRSEDGQGAGYASIGFYDLPLNDAERVELLTLARRSVAAAVRGEEFDPSGEVSPRLTEPGAAFVTLEINRRLRGGMGQVQAVGPLYRSVITSARSAAMEDDRFAPVSSADIDELSYEVSVLTPLVPVLNVRDIELGVHGLYLLKDGHAGMLLPQVPLEQGWDLEEYLRQISLRAGLPPDAWKDEAARLWSFTTEIVR